jgi:2,4-dienoyl-CoA reductase-like NADH-dependent reductase (Old Yellow Enzyme family)
MPSYPKIAQLRDVETFRAHLSSLGIELPIDDKILTAAEHSPLAEPLIVDGFRIGNRWCVHPMEGWDANADGSPSDLTLRRWQNFGRSGAKWIWGGEAAAVREDGRANPNQTLAVPRNKMGLAQLRETLLQTHQSQFGSTSIDDLFVGLQLTHSGRFCRLASGPAPRIAYHHPLLDAKFGIDPKNESVVWSDSDLEQLIDDFLTAAKLAYDVGFHFVDVKCCHGYLLHEFLSARRRSGPFGGDLDGRTRLLRTIIDRTGQEVPGLKVAVRLSVFDTPPFKSGRAIGEPMDFQHLLPYDLGFGTDPEDPLQIDWREPLQLLRMLKELKVVALNVSCGSPYYNPHVQRPAIFPPSDGYQPPEDPLVGVARQIHAARRCKEALSSSDLPLVGTGYSYLQDYLPHVAQAVVRAGWIDAVGLGRMILAYPELPADCLQVGVTQRKRVCRTFSDCTTGPRNGLVSGCFPLDPFYKALPAFESLKKIKSQQRDDSLSEME